MILWLRESEENKNNNKTTKSNNNNNNKTNKEKTISLPTKFETKRKYTEYNNNIYYNAVIVAMQKTKIEKNL